MSKQEELGSVCLYLWVQGVQCRTLQGHAHWVNTLALSTDYILRTGAFEPATATVNPQDLTGSCKDLANVLLQWNFSGNICFLAQMFARGCCHVTSILFFLSGRTEGESFAEI